MIDHHLTDSFKALARCCTPDTDPQDWDIPAGDAHTPRMDHFISCMEQAQRVCGGCPVARACAIRALDLQVEWRDVIVAGVPMLSKVGKPKAWSNAWPLGYEAIERVARGDGLEHTQGWFMDAMVSHIDRHTHTPAIGSLAPTAVG